MAHASLSRHMRSTQREQAHPSQKKNNAEGYTFTVSSWERLQRFLMLGSEGGTFYVSERNLTRDNATCVEACLGADHKRALSSIVQASKDAPKIGPSIFALAMACSYWDSDNTPLSGRVRHDALRTVADVCRTGTHLFMFLSEVKNLRGFGRGLRKCVEHWYKDKPADKLAYQVVKYQNRNGWSHRDAFRLCHGLQNVSDEHNAIIRWILGKPLATSAPALIEAFEAAKHLDASSKEQRADLIKLICKYNLTREMVPTSALNYPDVWEALLQRIPLTAMIRNLGKLGQVGLLKPMSDAEATVVRRLLDRDYLTRSYIHPIAVLNAQRVYASGHGQRGKLQWGVSQPVVDALEAAFYITFDTVQPSGEKTMLCIDVSGSMSYPMPLLPGVTYSECAAVMAMVTARTESTYHFMAFNHGLQQINIGAKSSLAEAIGACRPINYGGTDCAIPMLYARSQGLNVDKFVVYTDNETWAGNIHPHVALRDYRRSSGLQSKLVVVGMAANEFTIANPQDPGMLDVVGFDPATPKVISAF